MSVAGEIGALGEVELVVKHVGAILVVVHGAAVSSVGEDGAGVYTGMWLRLLRASFISARRVGNSVNKIGKQIVHTKTYYLFVSKSLR